jgi:hypothetical protein
VHVSSAEETIMKLLAGLLAVVSLCAAADKDMQRAIAWERQKDRAAARQARLEKRHPSVPATPDSNAANRSDERQPGNTVKDPGPKGQAPDQDKDKVKK